MLSKIRKNQQSTIDSLQSSLDSETKSRIEAARLKKNVEGNLCEMELQLSCANQQVSETTKYLGQLQIQIQVPTALEGQGLSKPQGRLC